MCWNLQDSPTQKYIQVPPFLYVNPSKPLNTSSPTPPPSTHIFTILFTTPLPTPPLLALQLPSPSSPTWPISAAADESLEGGSIVLTASKSKPSTVIEAEDDDGDGAATVTARTASATASSAWVGSKNVLGPTAMTRRVIGGRVAVEDAWGLVLGFVLVCGG